MSDRAQGAPDGPRAWSGQATLEPIETKIAAFLKTVRRRRGLFCGAVATLLVASLIAVLAITPQYTARALVMVDPREERVVDIDTVLARLTADDPAIQSEVQVLRSEELARRVVARTGLGGSPEFNPTLTDSLVDALLRSLDWPWLSAAFGEILADPDGSGDAEREQARVIQRYFDRLDVSALGRGSRVIEIAFSSQSPEQATWVANAIADTYIGLQLESKVAATERAAHWLEDRLASLGAEVAAAEKAIEDARAEIVAAGGWDPQLLEQQIGLINIQLIQAHAASEQAHAELRQITGLVASKGPEAVFEAVDPQLLIWTNEQLMWLRRSEAELKAQYGPEHPVVEEVREAIRRSIEETSARLIAGAHNRMQVADAKVRALEQHLKQLVEEAITFRRGQAQLRALEREATASKELYETLLARSKETAQTGLEQPDARIVSHGSVPARPSFPNRLLLLGVALVGSIALGGALVGVVDGVDRGYRNADEVTRDLQVRVLGEVPRVRKQGALAELLISDPASAFAEAFRTVATALELARELPERGKTLLVTSSLPKEGKTTLVTCLARTLAASGWRVLVIDCDVRHPDCHKALHRHRTPGLSSYLTGNGRIEGVIQDDGRSGVHLIAAGEATQDPLQLLRSERLSQLLRDQRHRYDVILLDSPPLLPVADTRLLVRAVDRCLLVVRWRTTDRKAVMRAFEQLTQAGGKVLGVVLGDVKDTPDQDYGDYYASYRAAHEQPAGRAS